MPRSACRPARSRPITTPTSRCCCARCPSWPSPSQAISEPALRIPGAHRIPMTNGVADISGEMPAGMRANITKGSSLTERDDVLVRLNSALATEDAEARHPEPRHAPFCISTAAPKATPSHVNDSVHLFVADGSKATVIETFSGTDEAHLSNHASYVAVGEGRRVHPYPASISAAPRRPISPPPNMPSAPMQSCAR